MVSGAYACPYMHVDRRVAFEEPLQDVAVALVAGGLQRISAIAIAKAQISLGLDERLRSVGVPVVTGQLLGNRRGRGKGSFV